MFNKDESNNATTIEIKNEINFKKFHSFLISSTFILMLKYQIEKDLMNQQMEFEDKKTAYIYRKRYCSTKKQYNEKINSLYHHGKLIINQKEKNLKDFFITYHTQKKDNAIKLINIQEDKINTSDYNGIIKFIDTTAFIELINNKNTIIKNNTILVENIDIIKNIVSHWDGLIHDKTCETDAVRDKRILRRHNEE